MFDAVNVGTPPPIHSSSYRSFDPEAEAFIIASMIKAECNVI